MPVFNFNATNQSFVYGGLSVQNVNSNNSGVFGEDHIVLIDNSGEGVISGVFPPGHEYENTTGYYTTRSRVRTVDLLGEGEIEGIVS